LAKALSALQDDMTPFDSEVAREIILGELMGFDGKGSGKNIELKDLEALVSSLSDLPVAAASIGQVNVTPAWSLELAHKHELKYLCYPHSL
jgi:predicted unusual protein kinase regulating ubiquinone biosynthesis (AarF/ABC1/UbiB family)